MLYPAVACSYANQGSHFTAKTVGLCVSLRLLAKPMLQSSQQGLYSAEGFLQNVDYSYPTEP